MRAHHLTDAPKRAPVSGGGMLRRLRPPHPAARAFAAHYLDADPTGVRGHLHGHELGQVLALLTSSPLPKPAGRRQFGLNGIAFLRLSYGIAPRFPDDDEGASDSGNAEPVTAAEAAVSAKQQA